MSQDLSRCVCFTQWLPDCKKETKKGHLKKWQQLIKKKKRKDKEKCDAMLKRQGKRKIKKVSNIFHETNILKGAKFTHINQPLLLGSDQLPNVSFIYHLYIIIYIFNFIYNIYHYIYFFCFALFLSVLYF